MSATAWLVSSQGLAQRLSSGLARNKRLESCQGSQAAAEHKLAAGQPASANEAECKMPEEEQSELQAARPHKPREQQHIVRGLSSSWQGRQQMH